MRKDRDMFDLIFLSFRAFVTPIRGWKENPVPSEEGRKERSEVVETWGRGLEGSE